jgi:tRNA threonylcarbamoyladenosine biosynthesis protein TsaE
VSLLCSVRSPDAATTQRRGRELGALLEPGDTLALRGPLGAGKTCLTQGIARGLGVPESIPVTSPTFTLVGEYPGRLPLRHADFYRIETEERLFEAGFDDLCDGCGILVVEWAERWPGVMPEDHVQICISLEPGGARTLELHLPGSAGPRARRLAEAVERAWAAPSTRA